MTELRNVFSDPFLFQVRIGKVPGYSLVDKFGKNISVGTSFETIWNGGGLYSGFDATAGETIEVFSDDAQDAGTLADSGTATGGTTTTLTGTGISGVSPGDVLINDTKKDHGIVVSSTSTEITVYYFLFFTVPEAGDEWRVATPNGTGCPVIRLSLMLDDNFDNENVEYIIMNGITPVDTVDQYMRCARGRGHGGTQVGEITARQNATIANEFFVMPSANGNSSMLAAYTIPRGKTGFLVDWLVAFVGTAQQETNVRGRVRPVGDAFQTLLEVALVSAGTSFATVAPPTRKGPIPEMSDFAIEAETGSGTSAISAEFTLLLIENTVLFQ